MSREIHIELPLELIVHRKVPVLAFMDVEDAVCPGLICTLFIKPFWSVRIDEEN